LNEKSEGGVRGITVADIGIRWPSIVKAIQPLLTEVGVPTHSETKSLLIVNPFKMRSTARSLEQQYNPDSDEHKYLYMLVKTLDELFVEVFREVVQSNTGKRTTH